MLHITEYIHSLEELSSFLEKNRPKEAFARSVLAQVFSGSGDQEWITNVCASIRAFSPRAVIVGATTSGEICRGRALSHSTVISLSFFNSSSLEITYSLLQPGDEKLAGKLLEEKILANSEPIKGLLLFATSKTLNCNELLKSIHDRMPDIPLFGAAAAGFDKGLRPLVFCENILFDSGIAAVLFTGDRLRVSRDVFFCWTPIGKIMTVTKTDGLKVLEIDGMPAFEIYKKYLGIKSHSQFLYNAMEFPLIFKRGDHKLASTAVYAHEDGGITYTVDINEGEQIQFSYAHVDTIVEQLEFLLNRISQFSPEAIYVYSCFTRRFLLQEDIEIEIGEFDDIAPSSGFFTSGEFCDMGDINPFLNTTMVIVSMAEGENRPVKRKHRKQELVTDPAYLRHSRILRKFRHFLKAVTDDLEDANHELKQQMDEIRELREIIPICSQCKKIRDDKGYWSQLDIYLTAHSNMEFTRGICPDCANNLYPEISETIFPEKP
jgi:hypothetical protein